MDDESTTPNSWDQFMKSGKKCYFCFLGWQKYENVHLEPNNLGHVECDAVSAGDEHA